MMGKIRYGFYAVNHINIYYKYLIGIGILSLIFIVYFVYVSHQENKLLDYVRDVDIDSEGRFKYILAKVYGKPQLSGIRRSKYVVRGNDEMSYHADIFEDIHEKVTKLGLTVKCFGGGKIEHKPKKKEIKVFGFSSTFGKADHNITRIVLLTKYPDYNITIANPSADDSDEEESDSDEEA